ncbi:hypothetical protein D3C87_1850940 [compost metagenome]
MSDGSNFSARARASAETSLARISGCGACSSTLSTPFAPERKAIRTRPAASSNTKASGAGRPAATISRASTTAVPTLGCPANGTSRSGVNIRTQAVLARSFGGNTKLVSE